jgi:PhnB protein
MSDTTVSLMLAVPDASEASQWYQQALGAIELWSLGSVRLEVLTSDPDSIVARAVDAGADGSRDAVRDHEMRWGFRRAGGFRDPFEHVWIVGDKSPLSWRGSVE